MGATPLEESIAPSSVIGKKNGTRSKPDTRRRKNRYERILVARKSERKKKKKKRKRKQWIRKLTTQEKKHRYTVPGWIRDGRVYRTREADRRNNRHIIHTAHKTHTKKHTQQQTHKTHTRYTKALVGVAVGRESDLSDTFVCSYPGATTCDLTHVGRHEIVVVDAHRQLLGCLLPLPLRFQVVHVVLAVRRVEHQVPPSTVICVWRGTSPSAEGRLEVQT